MAEPTKPDSTWIAGMIVAGVLILRFVWGAFVPGGEWPVSPAHYLAMAIDAGLLIGLVGMRKEISATSRAAAQPGLTRALFICGVASGIGLLLIRFTSDRAWWTGHLT